MGERKDKEAPLTLTLNIGDWEMIHGLLLGELNKARLHSMPAYAATCERLMRTIEYASGRK